MTEHRHTGTGAQTDTHRDRDRDTDTDRQTLALRQTDAYTDTHRQMDMHTQTDRQTDTPEPARTWGARPLKQTLSVCSRSTSAAAQLRINGTKSPGIPTSQQ